MFSSTVVGNLTTDPVEISKDSENPGTRLRIAFDEPNDGTGYISVLVWGAQAAACRTYLSKGRPVAVDGRLRYNEDSQGEKHVIVARSVKFLSSGKGQAHTDGNDLVETEGHSTEAVAA
jgi:single-strand DNA-binding protein